MKEPNLDGEDDFSKQWLLITDINCNHKYQQSFIINSKTGVKEYFNHCCKCGFIPKSKHD